MCYITLVNYAFMIFLIRSIGPQALAYILSSCLCYNYHLIVDYFSRFSEVVKMKSMTSTAVISAFKSIFSHFGILEILHTDNSPQFISA